MRKYYFLLCLVLSSLYAEAQRVYGTITDANTKEPLIFVNVVGPNRTGTTSLSDGSYSLDIVEGKHTLTFSYMGFQSQSITINVTSGNDINLDIQLVEQSSTLETVVLSAGKFEQRVEETTVSIEVIKPTLIDEKNTVKLQEAFQQTPGVNVVNDQVNIRSGSGWSMGAGSRVLMMVDDMPLMSPDAGQIQWKLLPNEAIYQMEVIKGASSALYGTSALNGLINVRTAIPTTKPRTEVNVFGGWYDSPRRKEIKWWEGSQWRAGATVLHAQKFEKSDLVLSANWLHDEGFRFQEVDKRARVNAKMTFYPSKIKGFSWGFNTSLLYAESGDAMIWHDYDTAAYITRDFDITLTHGWDYFIDPFVTYNHNRSKHTFRGRYMGLNNNAKSRTQNFENFSNYYYGEYQFQHFFENSLTFSAGGLMAFADSDSEVFQGRHTTRNIALYAQLDKKWKRLTASLGLRYEDYRVDNIVFNRPVIRTGLTYQAARATFVRASYGGGYRYPSMAELFTSTNAAGIVVVPNPELQAESGWSAELGVKQLLKIGENWKGIFDVAGFINSYDNMTEFTFFSWPEGLGFKSVNVGKTQVTGIELTLTGNGKIGDVDLRFLTGYAFMNPIILNPDEPYAYGTSGTEITYANTSSDNSNNILKYRYQNLFKLDLQTEYKGFGLGLSTKYNDYMQNIDLYFELGAISGLKESRALNPNGEVIFDARIYYEFSKTFRLSFIVDNLTNLEYTPRPGMLAAPRMFTFKATYRTGG